MSMISSLIDELNKSADEWNSSNMFELARMCRKAADTISELRGSLQVASVDYRHLSDELSAAKHDLSIFSGRIVELDAENAKLRELCSKFAQVVANDDATFRRLREIAKRELGYDFIGAYDSSLGDMDQLPLFSDHMRELEIEVES